MMHTNRVSGGERDTSLGCLSLPLSPRFDMTLVCACYPLSLFLSPLSFPPAPFSFPPSSYFISFHIFFLYYIKTNIPVYTVLIG